MALPQQKYRELVFQALYGLETGGNSEEMLLPLLMKQLAVSRKAVQDALAQAHLIQSNKVEIDAKIAKTSQAYSFDRIQTVEKNVLRLGIYELLYSSNTPPKVAISEAMRLAKKFSSPESAAFVNAILDAIYKESQGLTSNKSQILSSSNALIEHENVVQEAAVEKPLPNESDED